MKANRSYRKFFAGRVVVLSFVNKDLTNELENKSPKPGLLTVTWVTSSIQP